MTIEPPESMVQALAHLLRDHGDGVLDETSVLTLLTPSLQVATRLYEQLCTSCPELGFQAIPVHATDSDAVLRTQFLLDILQKTITLKIIHPPECPPLVDLNIYPFKSLKNLELHSLPPRYLRGLRAVYSQLEVLTCSQCVTSIEEVLSLCGGDLCSALQWLELHTLNFSNNAIHSLDQSLELLNNLRNLDLSHNLIKDCGPHLTTLFELQHVNLGYNVLASVPELSLQSSFPLQTLILNYNQLSSTSGLEHLSGLQHLDLSYNLLRDHSQLKFLARLHKLKELLLEGNPLYYIQDHRVLTVQHLSRKVSDKVLLDGEQLTAWEIAYAQVLRERVKWSQPRYSVIESSCTGDLTDSTSEKIATQIPRKKSKIKIRGASISGPSENECEKQQKRGRRGRRVDRPLVLQHKTEIDHTDNFRELYGSDWLTYMSHLEEELHGPNHNEPPSKYIFPYPFNKNNSSPTILQTDDKPDSQSPASPEPDASPTPEVSNVAAAADLLIEKVEDVLEDGLWELQKNDRKRAEEEEEDIIKDALCLPVTVCPIINGQPRNPDWPWIFLRVTQQHLLEIDLERGKVLIRRELQSLKQIDTSVTQWNMDEEEQERPVLTLHFDSMVEDKQNACYVVLDNSDTISIKTLLDVLNPILEENLRLMAERDVGPPKLQCLKCKTEFINQDDSGIAFSFEAEGQTQDKMSHDLLHIEPDPPSCPSCGSCHLILLLKDGSSTPTPTPSPSSDQSPEGSLNGGQKSFYLGEDERDGSETSRSSPDGSDSMLNAPRSPNQTLDFRLVDHRLKLYLAMEILVGNKEEFQCSIRVPVVRYGKEEEFWALVVISNQKIYFMEIDGEASDPPFDWLRLRDAQKLKSLTHLHMGLQKQALHLGFGTSNEAYTLLTRNCHFSTAFKQQILDALYEIPRRIRNALDYGEEEEVAQGHRFWHLLQDDLDADSCSLEEYRYLLVHFLQEDVPADKPADSSDSCANTTVVQPNTVSPAARAQGAADSTSVSLLLTRTHLYILEETHQWFHTPSPAAEDKDQEPRHRVQLKEKQPIRSISSVHLYSSANLHLRIQLYSEAQQKQNIWRLWTEDPDVPQQIAEWIRVPWEAEFDIPFSQVTHETLD